MKYIKQSVEELIPLIVGFLAYVLIRLLHGPINIHDNPGYMSFLLILVAFSGLFVLTINKKKLTKTSFIRLLLSSTLLFMLGVYFLSRIFT